jgi:hypothetical protein
MLRQYYWFCNSYSANRQSATKKKKILQKLLTVAANSPCFPNERRMPRSANNISRYVAHTALPILAELAYNFGTTDRKQKKGIKKRWRPPKTTK